MNTNYDSLKVKSLKTEYSSFRNMKKNDYRNSLETKHLMNKTTKANEKDQIKNIYSKSSEKFFNSTKYTKFSMNSEIAEAISLANSSFVKVEVAIIEPRSVI